MTQKRIHFVDPWFKTPDNQKKLPRKAQLIAHFSADDNGWVDYDEACYLHRTQRRDELWVWRGSHDCMHDAESEGRAVRRTRQGTDKDAAVALLELYLELLTEYTVVKKFKGGRLMDLRGFEQILDNIKKRRDLLAEASRQQALNTPSALVDACRELGLCPEPSGTNSHSWYANCPGTSHRLMVSTKGSHEGGEFGCGYCRVKGGVEELRALVAKRRDPGGQKTRKVD